MIELKSVRIKKPDEVSLILGQSHFIKTAEDLYEVLVGAVPGIQFGFAFVESSGACKVRCEGTDSELKKLAAENALEIAAQGRRDWRRMRTWPGGKIFYASSGISCNFCLQNRAVLL